MRMRKDKDFLSFFDEHTGSYLRTGRFQNGRETDEDPFMSSFPELLDVGIMGHCRHGSLGLCLKAGVECYQDGLNSTSPNMDVSDFASIVAQCRNNTYQIALGGCGDPDQHEQFAEILALCRENGIAANFTTSGLGLTEELVDLCREYCGAVAVSWYRSPYTLRALGMLLGAGVKTNIHYVLSQSSIDEAVERLERDDFPAGVNAVVFLLHKPVGLGRQAEVLEPNDPKVGRFLRLAARTSGRPYKIGFDSCSVPGLLDFGADIDPVSIDTCEGARWSAYITSDMQMLPCSFDNQDRRWAVDLKTHTIQEAWYSPVFEDFRSRFLESCPECTNRDACLGGCPICPQIVLCRKKAS